MPFCLFCGSAAFYILFFLSAITTNLIVLRYAVCVIHQGEPLNNQLGCRGWELGRIRL